MADIDHARMLACSYTLAMNKLIEKLSVDAVWRAINPGRIAGSDVCLFFGGLLWVSALGQVVFYTTHGTVMGYWVCITGWMGFVLFQFAWYANLLQLLAVMLMYRYPNRAMLLAVLAVLLAGQSFWFDDIPGQEVNMHILRLGLGCWFWYVSMVMMTLGVIFGADERRT